MQKRFIILGIVLFSLIGVAMSLGCSEDHSFVEPLWLVDSEADWYEGDMEYCCCNDTDTLYFTGEKVLFEDGFTWTDESDATWTVCRAEGKYNNGGKLNIKLDCNPAPSMIKIEGNGVGSWDTIKLTHWDGENGDSPIDVTKHAYEVIWKARLNVDEGYDTWEIFINSSGTGSSEKNRVLYDYGGCKVRPFRDQISYKQGENRERVQFEHWGNMVNSWWNTGKVYFDDTHFIAYNDRYGDDDSSDGNLGGFYKEAEASDNYADWGCLDSRNPFIQILAMEKGYGEQFWLDYFKVVQVDETVSQGSYTSKIWDSGATRDWSQWGVSVGGSGSYDIDFGNGNGTFWDTLSGVPDSATLQLKITMNGTTKIDSIKISKVSHTA